MMLAHSAHIALPVLAGPRFSSSRGHASRHRRATLLVIAGLDPVICSSTVLKQMAASKPGHDATGMTGAS
jgi:hypothetical protein